MTQPHLKPREERTRTEQLLDFFKARLGTILGFLFILVGVALYLGFQPTITREMKIIGYSFLFLLPYGWIVGKKVIAWLHDPQFIYLVDLDARYLDGALYQIPFTDFSKLETRDGEMTQLTPNLYTAKDVDLDEFEATGTWRGSLPDPDLCRELQNVRDCRGDLEAQARRGFIWETSGRIIVRNAVRENVRSVIEMFETGTLPDKGASFHEAVDNRLEEWDLEETLDDIDGDMDQPPDAELSEEALLALEDVDSELAEQVEAAQSSPEVPADDD
jgi:hypothetical protein